MIGFDIEKEAWHILENAIARAEKEPFGLLMLTAGQSTLRLLPPFVITDSEIEQGLAVINELL